MLSKLRSLFSAPARALPEEPAARANVRSGQRVYAIGDIHGRLDLFDQLLEHIDADDAARGAAETTLILLGDLVDRGPDSRGVVERAMGLMASGRVRVLAGNQEEMMLDSLTQDETLRHFMRHGGKETLFSYGLGFEEYCALPLEQLRERMIALVPQSHIAFMEAMEDSIVVGDYLFVHAGIRPGVPLDQQTQADMRWIRREFLEHQGDYGHVVVHGHSISDEPQLRANRIGIDTGAFASGRLTALGLEGGERWFITAEIATEVCEAA